MENKKIAIIAIIIVFILGIGGAYAFGFFSSSTDFDNKFMSGTFAGDVSHNEINESQKYAEWTDSYEDKEKNITYNMSCIKGGSFLTDMYVLQGMQDAEVRNYNGVDWKIFYSQAVPTDNSTNDSDASNSSENIINVYICEADVDNVTYMINVISYDNATQCDGSLFCDLYKDNIQPLLESITLKDAKKAPKMYKILNISSNDFDVLQEQMEQIKAGNVSTEA